MQSPFNKLTSTKSLMDIYDYLKDKPRLNLIKLKDKQDSNLLHHCAFNNHLDKMKAFIKHMKAYYYADNDTNNNSEESHQEQYRRNMQAWVNEPNQQGYLPAHWACLYGNVDMLMFLEQLGTNLLYKSNMGQTLLHMCAQNNQLSPMLYLSTKDIDFNETNKEKQTCLHQAATRGFVDIVSFLLVVPGIYIDPLNHQEETPLMLAVQENKGEVVKRLLVKGADRNITNGDGQIPLTVARKKGFHKLQGILQMDYSCYEKTLIVCNKKTVYRPEEPSNLLVYLFVFLFFTAVISTHIIIQLEMIYLIIAGIYYMLILILYLMLLVKPDIKLKRPFHTLQPPICAECECKLTPNSYHCFICKRCIYRYDHHCPWINNCLGAHNYGKFTSFLFLLVLSLLEIGFLNVYMGFIEPSYRFDFPQKDIICYAIHGYNILICLFVFPVIKLLWTQLHSLCLNKTGYERYRNPVRKSTKDSLLNDESTASQPGTEQEGCSLGNCFKLCQEPPEEEV